MPVQKRNAAIKTELKLPNSTTVKMADSHYLIWPALRRISILSISVNPWAQSIVLFISLTAIDSYRSPKREKLSQQMTNSKRPPSSNSASSEMIENAKLNRRISFIEKIFHTFDNKFNLGTLFPVFLFFLLLLFSSFQDEFFHFLKTCIYNIYSSWYSLTW